MKPDHAPMLNTDICVERHRDQRMERRDHPARDDRDAE
jgi:hypothetical protein